MTTIGCALCDQVLPSHPILDSDHAFCCPGCQAVFRILSNKNQLDNFQENPVFQQALRAGLISNPALLEHIKRNSPNVSAHELERLHLEIQEMWCPSCAEIIRLILLQEKGIKNCVVDYATDLASIEFAPRYISKERIFELISRIGYRPSQMHNTERRAVGFDLYLRFIVAAFFSLNIMMFAYPLYATYFNYDDQGVGPLFAWLSMYASLPVLGYSAWPILKRFFFSIKFGLFGMETLVVLGVASAFGLSLYELMTGGTKVYFDSMTVIIVFVLLGKIIEAKAKFSAKDSLIRLNRALPRRGRKRFEDGRQEFVPMKEIRQGDILVALTGEKIVMDGIVVEGEGACDESLMNGEPIPITKQAGSGVLGGTLLKQGWLAYRAASTLEESALQRIINMVEMEIGHKAKYVRAADVIVRWFVPAVVLISLCAAGFCFLFSIAENGRTVMQTAMVRAISVLLISCPCAIGIAAPLAESHLLNALAKLGVIVRNRGCLANLGKETVFVFDKTGTVTEGHFAVLEGLENLDEEQQRILKGMSSHSNHPIARAIAEGIDAVPGKLEKVEEFTGKGIRGCAGDKTYFIGSEEFLRQQEIECIDAPASNNTGIVTIVYFAQSGGKGFPIYLGDRLRNNVKETVRSLSPAKTVLLSGDSRQTVEAVSNLCGFQKFLSGASPLQKREFIDGLRNNNETVCMLGDGVNDAPALTAAHIGISVVSAADISIQVSDILLTTDRLEVLPKMRHLAQKGHRIVKQNLFWAFFYNAAGIWLAASGHLSPIFAAFAMVASSLIVVINAQRLGKNDNYL